MTQPKTGSFTPGNWTHNLEHPSVAHGVQIMAPTGSIGYSNGLKAVCTMEPGKGLAGNTRLLWKAPEMYELLASLVVAGGDGKSIDDVVSEARRIKAAIDGEG